MTPTTSDSPTRDGTRRGAARRDGELRGDRVYAELRERLISLRIAPGTPIEETVTARELSVSRGSVREALRRLAADGLVVTVPKRGAFASELSITDLSHICEIRTALEPHAAHRAAERFGAIDQPGLHALLHELAGACHLSDVRQQISLYRRVHVFVARSAANPLMEEALTRYVNLSVRIWHYARPRGPNPHLLLDEHHRLLTAISYGNPERARAEMVRHIAALENAIREVL
ncbi:MAG TPA: GntR family transcriptional regulator [Solirubrobacteraceae bacterium]|nr:GntR family transcriptional regulator [Solirubrobacteraceae bacterium]